MKLVLMRHANAAGGSPDIARRLDDEGRAQAKARGKDLASFDFDGALVSAASRTKETFRLLQLDVEDVREESDLYFGSHETILLLLNSLPDTAETVLVVGHEPTISQAAAIFGAESERAKEIRGGVSPSTAIVLEFEKWNGPAEIVEIFAN